MTIDSIVHTANIWWCCFGFYPARSCDSCDELKYQIEVAGHPHLCKNWTGKIYRKTMETSRLCVYIYPLPISWNFRGGYPQTFLEIISVPTPPFSFGRFSISATFHFFPTFSDIMERIVPCMHTFIHTYIHACIHTCIHTYMHACMHTYIHAYINHY